MSWRSSLPGSLSLGTSRGTSCGARSGARVLCLGAEADRGGAQAQGEPEAKADEAASRKEEAEAEAAGEAKLSLLQLAVEMVEDAAPKAPEATPSGRGARKKEPQSAGQGPSRPKYKGVSRDKRRQAKPWGAYIHVTKDGKRNRKIGIAHFAKEEDAARAYDRVSIAKHGHAKAPTNFPITEYRDEWTELETQGVDEVVACERRRAHRMR